jgi:hypothetical protein
MHTVDAPSRLLELLREAGEEPVSLDELEIVGVTDPATALHVLELAGHAVRRVHDMRSDRPVTCVKLGAAEAPAATPAWQPVAAPPAAVSRRPLLAAVVLALLVLLAASRR